MAEHPFGTDRQTIDGALYNADEALRQLSALTREAARRAELLETLRERRAKPELRIRYFRDEVVIVGDPDLEVRAPTEMEALEAAVAATEDDRGASTPDDDTQSEMSPAAAWAVLREFLVERWVQDRGEGANPARRFALCTTGCGVVAERAAGDEAAVRAARRILNGDFTLPLPWTRPLFRAMRETWDAADAAAAEVKAAEEYLTRRFPGWTADSCSDGWYINPHLHSFIPEAKTRDGAVVQTARTLRASERPTNPSAQEFQASDARHTTTCAAVQFERWRCWVAHAAEILYGQEHGLSVASCETLLHRLQGEEMGPVGAAEVIGHTLGLPRKTNEEMDADEALRLLEERYGRTWELAYDSVRLRRRVEAAGGFLGPFSQTARGALIAAAEKIQMEAR